MSSPEKIYEDIMKDMLIKGQIDCCINDVITKTNNDKYTSIIDIKNIPTLILNFTHIIDKLSSIKFKNVKTLETILDMLRIYTLSKINIPKNLDDFNYAFKTCIRLVILKHKYKTKHTCFCIK